jgi:hypothetical protein
VLLKTALLFLLAMAVIGWVGSLLGRRTPLARLRDWLGLPRPPGPGACPACGRPRIGPGACPCGQG